MPASREQRLTAPAHATGAVEFVDLTEIAPDETFRVRPDGDVSHLATSLGRLGQLVPVDLRALGDGGEGGPRWQVVSGFRRLAAVRLLARERVLARLHDELSDEDAWAMALGEALLQEPLTREELLALRERLRAGRVAAWADELVDEAIVRAPVAPELRERFFDFLATSAAAAAPPAPAAPDDVMPAVDRGAPAEAASVAASGDEAGPAEASAAPRPALVSDAPVSASSTEEIVEVTPEELVHDLAGRMWALNQDLATAFEAWDELPADGRRLLLDQARYVAALLPLMEARE